MLRMPGKGYRGPFLPLEPPEIKIRDNIKKSVSHLSSIIGERNIWKKGNLENAARYIAESFRQSGLLVSEQSYLEQDLIVKNIIGEKKGTQKPEEIIVMGAHYDSVWGSPGADDNATGVAAILEMANFFSNISPARTLHFVAFVNEEPPFYWTRHMGSWHYAKEAYNARKKIAAMFSIESIGYYSEQKYSQSYPFPLGFFYPNTADFIGFVGNLSSRSLVHQAIAAFRKNIHFPSEGISAPSWIPDIAWSDQWAFWKHGFPAVMITDTALYRNPHYHTENDLSNTLDYDRMARVVYGLSKMFLEMNSL